MRADSIRDGGEMEEEFPTFHAETLEVFQLGLGSETVELFWGGGGAWKLT